MDTQRSWAHCRAITLNALMMCTLLIGMDRPAWAVPPQQGTETTGGSQADSLTCPPDAAARAARAIHFAGSADFWREGETVACRLDPAHADRVIVALTYVHGEEMTGKPHEGYDAYDRDLDLVVMDLTDDKVIAHRHEDGSVEDGGERFEGISIDTGRYLLAPGKRAFGIRTHHSTHCTCANDSNDNLALYLQNGAHLDRIMTTSVYSWQAEFEKDSPPPPACTPLVTVSKTAVVLAQSKSHGLADLQLMTTETPSYEANDVSTQCPALIPVKQALTLHYDGNVYK